MRPIHFQCQIATAQDPVAICEAIADVSTWDTFTGSKLLPGVRSASYEKREAGMVGSVIRVENTDGSTHVEHITAWEPGKSVEMRLEGFSPPLSRLATHFTEEWRFPQGTIVRDLQLHPISRWTRPMLWIVSRLLKGAIERHLRTIAETPDPK